jgi:hypothetical protein
LAGMGEIEKVGDLGIEKSHIGSVKISPFRLKKFENNELI